MGRSFLSLALQAARAADRAERERVRNELREQKQLLREANEKSREDKRLYLESRAAEVDDMNAALAERCAALQGFLSAGMATSPAVNWQDVQKRIDEAELDAKFPFGDAPDPQAFVVSPPGLLGRLMPGGEKRYLARAEAAQSAYQQAVAQHEELKRARQMHLGFLTQAAAEHNEAVSRLQLDYCAGKPEAVSQFFELMFELCPYHEDIVCNAKIGYIPESRCLVVDVEVPTLADVIPDVEKYRFVKSTDEVQESKKTLKAKQGLYSSFLAQAVLRRLFEIFNADEAQTVDVANVNIFVNTVDPATGKSIRPCLLSVRTTKDEFLGLDLRRVEPTACLKRLNATISRSPSELVPVKPIMELNMVDPRFIQETDVLSALDDRTNLMELTPGQFENLIANLFQRMGLETKLTQASRDGGVDCVAFDARPVIGGKVIVQAKRYKNTVGVSAVRDLYGAMQHEKASKGILVTTSGYGPAAFEFANDKPISLLSGSNLLSLLKEHSGIDAKIIMPEDWRDPLPMT